MQEWEYVLIPTKPKRKISIGAILKGMLVIIAVAFGAYWFFWIRLTFEDTFDEDIADRWNVSQKDLGQPYMYRMESGMVILPWRTYIYRSMDFDYRYIIVNYTDKSISSEGIMIWLWYDRLPTGTRGVGIKEKIVYDETDGNYKRKFWMFDFSTLTECWSEPLQVVSLDTTCMYNSSAMCATNDGPHVIKIVYDDKEGFEFYFDGNLVKFTCDGQTVTKPPYKPNTTIRKFAVGSLDETYTHIVAIDYVKVSARKPLLDYLPEPIRDLVRKIIERLKG